MIAGTASAPVLVGTWRNPPGFPWSRLSCAGRFALAAGWRGSSPAPRPHAASVLPVPAAFRLCELFVSCVKGECLSKESFKPFKCILIRSGQIAQGAIQGAIPLAWKYTFAHALLSHLQTSLPSITGPWEAQLAKYLDPPWQPAVSLSSTLLPAQPHVTIRTAGSVPAPSPLPASHCSPSPRTLPPACHPSLPTLVSPIAATAIQPISITKRRILCKAAEKPWLYNVPRVKREGC